MGEKAGAQCSADGGMNGGLVLTVRRRRDGPGVPAVRALMRQAAEEMGQWVERVEAASND